MRPPRRHRRGCSGKRRPPGGWPRFTVPAIAKLIYPVSFYRTKARHVKAACDALLDRFGGRVPGTMEELLTLPGVGRKTANLVLILGFKSLRNICVDTHVHRISNRLGWVQTRTARADRAGALRTGARALVAVHQPVSGDLGPERVPADSSPVRRLRRGRPVPARRCDEGREIAYAERVTRVWCIIRHASRPGSSPPALGR